MQILLFTFCFIFLNCCKALSPYIKVKKAFVPMMRQKLCFCGTTHFGETGSPTHKASLVTGEEPVGCYGRKIFTVAGPAPFLLRRSKTVFVFPLSFHPQKSIQRILPAAFPAPAALCREFSSPTLLYHRFDNCINLQLFYCIGFICQEFRKISRKNRKLFHNL